MPLKNTLNVSELLKRLGVVGDSQASAELLNQIRLNIQIGDLSPLVPPLRGPIGAGSQFVIPGAAKVPNWTLQCRSPGGLQILSAALVTTPANSSEVGVFITTTNPWAAPVVVAPQQLAFEQVADSVMTFGTTVASLLPASAVSVYHGKLQDLVKDIWLGPGQFLNFEASLINTPMEFMLSWQEFPGMLNP